MDCSLPGSSVHGILQTRKLEGVAKRALKRKMKRTLIKKEKEKEKESKKKGRKKRSSNLVYLSVASVSYVRLKLILM